MNRAKRTRRSWNSRGTSGSTGCLFRRFMREDLKRGAYLEEDLGRHHAVPVSGCESRGRRTSRQRWWRRIARWLQLLPRFQVEAGRDLNYKVCYPRGELRPAVDYLGPELLQVLLSAAGGNPVQRAGAGGRFRPAHEFSARAPTATTSSIATSNRATSCCATASRIFSTTRADARARCSTTSPRCSSTARLTCRPRCASSCWMHYLDALGQVYRCWIATRSWSTTTPLSTCASCRRWERMGFAGFYERKAHFLQSVPYALKNLRWLLHNVELPMALPR